MDNKHETCKGCRWLSYDPATKMYICFVECKCRPNEEVTVSAQDINHPCDEWEAPVDHTRHAHWEWDPNGMDWNIGAWVCSKCKCKPNSLWESERNINPRQWAGSHYCPNCGAKMDEVPNEKKNSAN